MKYTIFRAATALVATFALHLGSLSAASVDEARLNVLTPESIRSSLGAMTSDLTHSEIWELTNAIHVLGMPDLWNYSSEYDEQMTTDEMIEFAAVRIENSGDRRRWIHDCSVDDILTNLELLRTFRKSGELLVVVREIADLKSRIAESQAMELTAAKSGDPDIDTSRERIDFLKKVAAKLEAL